MTLRELLKEYISGEKKLPVKIVSKRSETGFYLEVVYIGKDKVFAVTVNGVEVIAGLNEEYYAIRTEQKKKVKYAPYIIKERGCNAYFSAEFYKDNDEAKKDFSGNEVEWIKRCDVLETETEIDEE